MKRLEDSPALFAGPGRDPEVFRPEDATQWLVKPKKRTTTRFEHRQLVQGGGWICWHKQHVLFPVVDVRDPITRVTVRQRTDRKRTTGFYRNGGRLHNGND